MLARNKYTKNICRFLLKREIGFGNDKHYAIVEAVIELTAKKLNLPKKDVREVVLSTLTFTDNLLRFVVKRRPLTISKLFLIRWLNFGVFVPAYYRWNKRLSQIKESNPKSPLLKRYPQTGLDELITSLNRKEKRIKRLNLDVNPLE